MEELSAQYETVAGRGNDRGLEVGGLFSFEGFPRQDQNQEYLIVAATHLLQSDEYRTALAPSAGQVYECAFVAAEGKQPFRAPQVTPKPVVHGPQTAIVVGKQGEEIYTDKYGRVKVQFHWDREGKSDENSSCWIRVSQLWAGKNWGGMFIPRIGQEVLVEFLEGDPDQPIITGKVYNADQTPPYNPAKGGVVSGLRSNTHKGKGYNEMSMDDTAGKEKITIHSQYDMSTMVEHDLTETTKNNAKIEISEG